LDNDGDALVTGALYYDTTETGMFVYDGSQWLVASSATQAILTVYNYTATSGQTTFSGVDDNTATLTYVSGSIIVTLNGIFLEDNADYTATSGTSVTLTTGANSNDELNVYAYNTFDSVNVYALGDTRYFQLSSTNEDISVNSITATGGTINGTSVGASTPSTGAFTSLSTSGVNNLAGLTASTALALDVSKNVVSVANTGTGSNVLNTSPTLVTPALGTPSSGIVTNLTGTASININGTVGASTPSTGAFTSLSASGATTLSGGTANGVTYLNGSKVLTSGSALTFDGANLGVGVASASEKLDVYGNLKIGTTANSNILNRSNTHWVQYNGGATTNDTYIRIASTDAASIGRTISLHTNGLERMRIDSSGNVGIGTSSPNSTLNVVGPQTTFDTNVFGQVLVRSTAAYNATPLAGIVFSVKYNAGGTYGVGSSIQGYKLNAGDGDFGQGLLFTAQANGAAPVVVMRATSTGLAVTGAISATTTINGALNGTVGATTAAAGTFTTLNAAFGTTAIGIKSAPLTDVRPGGSIFSTGGVISTVKLASQNINLVDVRANELTTVANGRVTGGYFQIDNANAAVNSSGGQIGVYGLVNGISNYTTGHQYGLYGRSGSGGTNGYGVVAALGSDVSISGKAALLVVTDNTTDSVALFRNGAGEKMRLDSIGNLLVGTTTNATGVKLNVVGTGAANFESTQANASGVVVRNNSANNDAPSILAGNTNTGSSGLVTLYSSLGTGSASNTNCFHLKAITQGVAIYYLYGNGTSSFTSDVRLKKNIETARNGYAEDLCKLRVVKYQWNANDDSSPKELGLIAQEVEQVFPGLVQNAADQVQGITPKVLKASVLPFMLLKAIQEQQALIESLTARIEALEGN